MDQMDITLPSLCTRDCIGYTFDIGGTMCKIVYRKKLADFDDGRQLCTWCCQLYKIDDIDKAIKAIKDNADIRLDERVVHTTGVSIRGATKQMIEKELEVRVENLSETDCGVYGFYTMACHLKRQDLLYMPHEEGFKAGIALGKSCQALAEAAQTSSDNPYVIHESAYEWTDDDLPYVKMEKNLFPCLFVSLGTGGNYNVVQEDGTYLCVDGTDRSGKYMMGLASLMLDIRVYNELMDLAVLGDASKVSNYMKDLKSPDQAEFYALFPDELLIFSFGKAATSSKECFERKDIARALVTAMASDHVCTLYWMARAQNCKRVFLSGGFVSHPLMRETLTKLFVSRSMYCREGQIATELHFLKHNNYINAIGTLTENGKYLQKMKSNETN